MIDYTQIEDYDCPDCTWSIHVEKRVWDEVEDHSLVIAYIQSQVKNHNATHGVKKNTSIDYSLYNKSPYVHYSDTSNSLIVVRDDEGEQEK